jgi:2-oxoglutarate ferredoxin oxidoreductase subunit beta
MDLVLSLKPTFAARSFSGNIHHMTSIIQRGIKHKGFSYVEILQSCPTFNKTMTHEWYLENTIDLDEYHSYNQFDFDQAKRNSTEFRGKIPIGVLYQNKNSKDFYLRQKNRENIQTELVDEVENVDIGEFLEEMK